MTWRDEEGVETVQWCYSGRHALARDNNGQITTALFKFLNNATWKEFKEQPKYLRFLKNGGIGLQELKETDGKSESR